MTIQKLIIQQFFTKGDNVLTIGLMILSLIHLNEGAIAAELEKLSVTSVFSNDF